MAGLTELAIAFKEWAVICRALAEGRQALILRKGGIAEQGDVFRVEHQNFWLYPTFVHQQQEGICPEYRSLLEAVQSERPPAGKVRLQTVAQVVHVVRLQTLDQAQALTGWHGWSTETVHKRYHYREPGLVALAVRIYQAPAASELDESADYAGCKSWVQLERALPTAEAVPVLSDAVFSAVIEQLQRVAVL